MGQWWANGGQWWAMQWWPTKLFCEFPIIPASPPWLGRSQSSLNKSGPEPIFCWKALPPKTTSWVNQGKAWNSFKNITFLLSQGWVAQARPIHLPYPPSWCQDHLSLQFCTLCWEHICKKTICDKSPSIQTHDCRSFSTQVISESPIWRAIWSGHNIV